MQIQGTVQHTIELRAVDQLSNRRRQYRMLLTAPVETGAPYAAVVQCGRIGGRLRTRVYEFETRDAALQQLRKLIKKRQTRGYAVTFIEEGHPLTDWIRSSGIPTERSTARQLQLFEQ